MVYISDKRFLLKTILNNVVFLGFLHANQTEND